MSRLMMSLLLLAAAAPALAGRGSEEAAGGRIRYVDYDEDEVVKIDGVVGVVVHIVLEPAEKYVAHAFGDGRAWDFAFRGNHLFLKPVALDADTNLTVVTDRRSYHFTLRLRTEKGVVPTYELAFRYRAPRTQKAQEAQDREGIEESFQRAPARPNLHYSMSGDSDIAPVNCWDDGEFTTFKFAGSVDLPAIYMVDPDGKESIVDRHTTGPANELLVVHKVARRWVLRLGSRALAIWNDGYSPEGRRNDTGTATADVKRVLWR